MFKHSNILKIMVMRRSFRKYENQIPDLIKFEYIKSCVKSFKQKFNIKKSFVEFYHDEKEIKQIVKASFKGFVGKINPWLFKCNAPAFAVIGFENHKNQRIIHGYPQGFVESSFLGEVMILSEIEKGIGSCWVGGINEKEIVKTLSLKKNTRIIAISPLGFPHKGSSYLTWDKIANKLVSKRRKPLDHIVYGFPFNWEGSIKKNSHREYHSFEIKENFILNLIQNLNGKDNPRLNLKKPLKDFYYNLFEAARIAPSAENR